ncbi:MAG: serine/threonine-protein kinase, partial [Planctomycetota bacterium]
MHFPLRRGEEDAANQVLGSLVDSKYRVQSVLGKGGMGTVFRAIHEVSLVPVALKILNPRFSQRREYREHFLAEAQKAGRVTHEHTARIMDVGEAEDGTVYIAMEIVNGVTLHECIHSEVPLVPVQVVDILQQICDALSAAHQAGLVHRDLSTRNVMVVSRQGKPFIKVLDFGIAKGMPMLQYEIGPSAAAAPVGFASPPYSAPEHLERKNVDARADLYSLGVIGYEALTGHFPVDGNSGHELAEATLQGAVIPLEPRPGTPMRLVRLIERLLAKDPGRRPSSANEVLAELYRIRQRGSPLVRTLAVASMVVALFLLTLAFAVPQERVCVIQSGSIDVTAPGVKPKLQLIQSSVIQHLRFDYAGFDVRDILVEIKQGDGPPRPLSLLPEAADGVADLAPTPDKLRYVCDELRKASRDGDVDLIFRWRARPPFGVARLRIDDEAPTIDLEPSQRLRDTNILSSHDGCYLDLKVQDQNSPVSVTLSGFYLGGDPKDSRRMGEPIPLPTVPAKIQPVVILGNLHRGPKPSGPVGLRVAATDAAGNAHETEILRFEQMDFAVPSIELRGVLTAMHDESSAALLLPVDEAEDDLIVHIKGPQDLSRSLSPMRRGSRELLIRLPKPADSDFVSGTYQIRLEDPAGNRSPEPFEVEIMFRSIDVEVRFQLDQRDQRTKALRIVELTGPERLVWDGRSLTLPFTHDPFYEPREVRLKQDGKGLGSDLC